MTIPIRRSGSADSRAALRYAGAGLVCLVGGMVIGGLAGSDGLPLVLPVAVGFVALVAGVDQIADEIRARVHAPLGDEDVDLLHDPIEGETAFRRATWEQALDRWRAQQTVFNVPTADVLDRGRVYLETDWLWRPNAPGFSSGEIRAVYGAGSNVEVGLNLGGFAPRGPSAIVVMPNVKWQPHHSDSLSLTAGLLALFRASGRGGSTAAALGYAHAALRLPIGTRLTAGGWMASSHYAGSGVEKGGLFGLEQPIVSNVTLAADWYTGASGLGYTTPGLIVTEGRWVLYASYTFKNGDTTYDVRELGCTDGSEPVDATGRLVVSLRGRQVAEWLCRGNSN